MEQTLIFSMIESQFLKTFSIINFSINDLRILRRQSHRTNCHRFVFSPSMDMLFVIKQQCSTSAITR
jgi:hypothetical protein